MKFFHDEGVVLRKHDVGEKDEVVILLTKSLGKTAIMSKGSRDPKSRKAGALQLANTIAFEARESKGKLSYLQQVKTLHSRGIALAEHDQSLGKFYRAMEILKLTDGFLQELQNVQYVYHDLNLALELIESPTIVLVYWVRLMNDLGYIPDWSSCSRCVEKFDLGVPLQFCAENQGFEHQLLCQKADDKSPLSTPVDSDVVKVLAFWQKMGIEDGVRVEVGEELMKKIRGILEAIEVHG
jgi:DNA repair protein RecO